MSYRTEAHHYQDRSIMVNLQLDGYLGNGNEAQVFRTYATVSHDENERTIPLALKLYKIDKEDEIPGNMNVYEFLKDNGFNVPPTFRKVEDGILMTDLSEEGRNLVLSMSDTVEKISSKVPFPADGLEAFKVFDLDSLRADYEKELQRASMLGVGFLTFDCWMLVVAPERRYSLQHTDFSFVYIDKFKRNSYRKNAKEFDSFISHMKYLQGSI